MHWVLFPLQGPLFLNWLVCIGILAHLLVTNLSKRSDALAPTRLRAAKRIGGFVVVFICIWAWEVLYCGTGVHHVSPAYGNTTTCCCAPPPPLCSLLLVVVLLLCPSRHFLWPISTSPGIRRPCGWWFVRFCLFSSSHVLAGGVGDVCVCVCVCCVRVCVCVFACACTVVCDTSPWWFCGCMVVCECVCVRLMHVPLVDSTLKQLPSPCWACPTRLYGMPLCGDCGVETCLNAAIEAASATAAPGGAGVAMVVPPGVGYTRRNGGRRRRRNRHPEPGTPCDTTTPCRQIHRHDSRCCQRQTGGWAVTMRRRRHRHQHLLFATAGFTRKVRPTMAARSLKRAYTHAHVAAVEVPGCPGMRPHRVVWGDQTARLPCHRLWCHDAAHCACALPCGLPFVCRMCLGVSRDD